MSKLKILKKLKIVTIAIVTIVVLTTNIVSAYYIPQEYMEEAKTLRGTVAWYNFAMKYSDQHWAYDILRQMAMNETNSGKISELHLIIIKYMRPQFPVIPNLPTLPSIPSLPVHMI